MSEPAVSVVIPTRNRRDELRQAILSILAQTVPVELIVMDDGSTDGTDEMMKEFPAVRYERLGGANGPCVLRNRGIAKATAPIVVSIDDDAWFPSPRTIEQTLSSFQASPRIGAVGIPFINVRQGDAIEQQPTAGAPVQCVYGFIGAAHAVRREPFLKLGGYRESFYYMVEESDFCVRLLAAGYVTVLARADPIHHNESPLRDLRRADFLGHRNLALFAWMNAPAIALMPLLVNNVFRGFLAAARYGRPVHMLKGTAAGLVWILKHPRCRAPLPLHAFRLFRRMRRQAIPLDQMVTILDRQTAVWRSASAAGC